jgi:hypothetical protein
MEILLITRSLIRDGAMYHQRRKIKKLVKCTKAINQEIMLKNLLSKNQV